MSRDINDPRIVEVIRVFYRHVGSSHPCAVTLASEYVAAIIEGGYIHGDVFEDWPTESLLALVTTFLQVAPEADLDLSVAIARAQLASLVNTEHVDAMERGSGRPCIEILDYPTLLKAEWEHRAEKDQVAS